MAAIRDFWGFSSAIYARPGVEAACLELQDRFGADVNIALYCLWIGMPLSPEVLESAIAAARPVREGFVEPLRRMRRALAKEGDEAALRQAVKAAELEAERLEQRTLEGLRTAVPPDIAAGRANMLLYALRLDAEPETFRAAAEPLLAAIANAT